MKCKLSAFAHANILNNIYILGKHGETLNSSIDLEDNPQLYILYERTRRNQKVYCQPT
jgi:hypothetical protein